MNPITELVRERKARMTSEPIKDDNGNEIDWFGLVSKRREIKKIDLLYLI